MKASRAVVAAGVVAAAWFGRGLVVPDANDDHAPFVPVARHVETEPADLDWSPTEGVRDPFAPLVFPSAE